MYLPVYIANGISVALMLMLIVTNSEHQWGKIRYNNPLQMINITIICSLAEIVGFIIDGKPGVAITIISYLTNSILFAGVVIISYLWLSMICKYVGSNERTLGRKIIFGLDALAIVVLLVNLFYPLVFSLNNNVYERQSFYWIFVTIAGCNVLYGLFVYFKAIKNDALILSFPVWAYVLPVIIGITLQTLFYGVSLVWPAVAISVTGIISSIKNRLIFIDLTSGVYNRYYLDKLRKDFSNREVHLTGIMADLNGFKRINDNFGHDAGDKAITESAQIFMNAVKGNGKVVRFAGDEFIIFINSTDEEYVNDVIKNINDGYEEFNKKNNDYKLSASMGISEYHSKEMSFDAFLKTIDEKMYESKKEYYAKNDRRKSGDNK